MSTPVAHRTAHTLFDFVKAADQAKQAGETGKLLLSANGEISFAPSGVSGFVTRLWEKFSDAVRSTNLVQQRHTQAQQAFEAFQAVLNPELQPSAQEITANPSKLTQPTSHYDSVTVNAMRQTLFDKLQANVPPSKNKASDQLPDSLTDAFKNVLHHDAHTLTPSQLNKNIAYASRDQRAADVVLVIGPNNDSGLIERLKKQCNEKNLKLLVIGDGVGPIPLSGMPDKLKDKTDQWTQFFVQAHGTSTQDGKLKLQIGAENKHKNESSIKEASLLFSAIQQVNPIGTSENTHPNYVTHVYACHGGTGEKSIHSSTDPLLQNCPFILHAASKHCTLNARSSEDMLAQIDYLSRCKAGGYAPLPAAQLAEAAFRSPESARLVVGGKKTDDKGRVLMPATKGPEQFDESYIAARFKKMKENATSVGMTEEAGIFSVYERQLRAGAATVLSTLTENAAWSIAIDHGNLEAIRAFLKIQPGLINETNGKLLSLPFTAALLDHPHVLDFYAKDHKLDLNAKNSKGMSLMMTAVKSGSLNVMDYLLKNKVDLSPNRQDISVLSLAAQIGNPETLKKLVEHLKNNADSKTFKAALKDAITVARDNKKMKALSYLEKNVDEYAIAK